MNETLVPVPRAPSVKGEQVVVRARIFVILLLLTVCAAVPQDAPQPPPAATRIPIPLALGIPTPGPTNEAPYAPRQILQGGVVVPLYPPGSPVLKMERVREAELYNMSKSVPGRISSIVNIHNPPIPRNAPPAFITCAGSGDRVHALWANEYFTAMLQAGIPNIEMHIYGNGRHPGDPLSDGSRMTGGLTDRNGTPFGTWKDRYIDWFRDLGFLQKPAVETKAARDIATFMTQPPRGGGRRGGQPGGATNTLANPTGAAPQNKVPVNP